MVLAQVGDAVALTEGAGAGVILALLVQAGTLIYWGGKLTQRVTDHGKRLESVEGKQDEGLQRLSVVETQIADHLEKHP